MSPSTPWTQGNSRREAVTARAAVKTKREPTGNVASWRLLAVVTLAPSSTAARVVGWPSVLNAREGRCQWQVGPPNKGRKFTTTSSLPSDFRKHQIEIPQQHVGGHSNLLLLGRCGLPSSRADSLFPQKPAMSQATPTWANPAQANFSGKCRAQACQIQARQGQACMETLLFTVCVLGLVVRFPKTKKNERKKDGLPLFGGVQLAVYTTMVSAQLHCYRAHCATRRREQQPSRLQCSHHRSPFQQTLLFARD